MTAFAALRALGWSGSRTIAAPPTRAADPAGDLVTDALVSAGLWRMDGRLGLVRDGRKVTIRLFLPEDQQSDRSLGADRAALNRAVIASALQEGSYAVRVSDALFCERGQKGWSVIVVAVELR